MKEQLWLGDDGTLVCPRPSCAGDELAQKILLGRNLEAAHRLESGKVFSRMSAADMAELGPLIAGGGGVLACDGDHVRYNFKARELQTLTVNA